MTFIPVSAFAEALQMFQSVEGEFLDLEIFDGVTVATAIILLLVIVFAIHLLGNKEP